MVYVGEAGEVCGSNKNGMNYVFIWSKWSR